MTDETDNHEMADSGRSATDKQNADVLATSPPNSRNPDVFLIQYPDADEPQYEPGTPMNQALFGQGLFSEIDGVSAFDYNGTPIELDADVSNDTYRVSVGGYTARIPSEQADEIAEAFQSNATGEKLYELYNDVISGQVRRPVVSDFLDRYPDDRIEVTEDGWVVDDTFLVTYEGTNHLVDVDPADPRSSNPDYDSSKQAVYLDVDARGERDLQTPSGETVTASELEQEFLTQVEVLLYPETYVGVELVDEIEQHKAEGQMLGDAIEDLTEQADVTGFTDSKTGNHHGSTGHSFDKHKLSDGFNVTEDVVDLLWSHEYDHAGVHELLLRKQEFIARPDVDVFEDVPDDNASRWSRIESTKESAPILPRTQQKLDEMYGG